MLMALKHSIIKAVLIVKHIAGPYPAQIFLGGSFGLKCGPMKTRQGNWGLVPENFEINAVRAA